MTSFNKLKEKGAAAAAPKGYTPEQYATMKQIKLGDIFRCAGVFENVAPMVVINKPKKAEVTASDGSKKWEPVFNKKKELVFKDTAYVPVMVKSQNAKSLESGEYLLVTNLNAFTDMRKIGDEFAGESVEISAEDQVTEWTAGDLIDGLLRVISVAREYADGKTYDAYDVEEVETE